MRSSWNASLLGMLSVQRHQTQTLIRFFFFVLLFAVQIWTNGAVADNDLSSRDWCQRQRDFLISLLMPSVNRIISSDKLNNVKFFEDELPNNPKFHCADDKDSFANKPTREICFSDSNNGINILNYRLDQRYTDKSILESDLTIIINNVPKYCDEYYDTNYIIEKTLLKSTIPDSSSEGFSADIGYGGVHFSREYAPDFLKIKNLSKTHVYWSNYLLTEIYIQIVNE